MKKLLTVLFLLFAVNLYSQVVINEVMYAPTILQRNGLRYTILRVSAVSLQNWKWKDAATTNPVQNNNNTEYFIECKFLCDSMRRLGKF